MGTYQYSEPSGYDETFTADSEEAAEEYARDLLRTGDYGVVTATLRLHASIARIEDGEPAGWRRVTAYQEPAEPQCPQGEHSWDDGQPWASSHGGVKYTDTCTKCGLRRTRDSGATCHDCGEAYDSLSYERGEA